MDKEIEIAAKYGIFLSYTVAEDDDGVRIADGMYIYQPLRYSDTFFALFGKLGQLNNYCFYQLLACHSHLSNLISQRLQAENDARTSAEELMYFDDEIPDWEDNVEVIARATIIVQLCSFVEWALRRLSTELTQIQPRKTQRYQSDIDFLLRHIKEHAGLKLPDELEGLQVIHEFRAVRNAFAHGDWVAANEGMMNFSLRTCFTSVSRFFEQIEEAAWQSSWGADSGLPPAEPVRISVWNGVMK